MTRFIVVALLCFAFVRAADRSQELKRPAPSSYLTETECRSMASFAALMKPGLSIVQVEPTGSMLPVFDSHSILIVEKVKGADLKYNDIALYSIDQKDNTTCHRVKAVKPGAVYMSGDNNKVSDGWIDSNRILYRVVGIIYGQR